jgi:D-xylose 1-dehydrogenase (NADP+, D-xylono-1,5-lactone-forming)
MAGDGDVVAVASRERSRAEGFAREHGINRAYGSYQELLSDPGVDVVYISLPNSMHLEWTARALECGKHVLCEKPFGRNAHKVQEVFDLADRQGRLLMEAFMYRHNPQTKRLQQLVGTGAVGQVRLLRASHSFIPGPGDVRLSARLDGGALMDLGCYCVDISRLIAGEPVRVTAQQVIGGNGVDLVFAAMMSFSNDVVAHFVAGLALVLRHELEVIGDEGSLFLADPWNCDRPVIEVRRGDEVERIRLELVDSYRLEAENMAAAIKGEGTLLLSRADAVAQARAIEALYCAAEGNQPVTLD